MCFRTTIEFTSSLSSSKGETYTPTFSKSSVSQSQRLSFTQDSWFWQLECFISTKSFIGTWSLKTSSLILTDTSNWLQPKKEDKAGFNPFSHFLSLGYRNAPAAAAAAAPWSWEIVVILKLLSLFRHKYVRVHLYLIAINFTELILGYILKNKSQRGEKVTRTA